MRKLITVLFETRCGGRDLPTLRAIRIRIKRGITREIGVYCTVNWSGISWLMVVRAKLALLIHSFTPLSIKDPPPISFFLYVIQFGWGVGEESGNSVPYSPYIGASFVVINTYFCNLHCIFVCIFPNYPKNCNKKPGFYPRSLIDFVFKS